LLGNRAAATLGRTDSGGGEKGPQLISPPPYRTAAQNIDPAKAAAAPVATDGGGDRSNVEREIGDTLAPDVGSWNS
jgi:hypothetical protein